MAKAIRRLQILSLLFLIGCGAETEFVPLFNGRDLSGWKNVNGAPSTWTVRDGMIACSGIPTGVLCTERQYENFVLELEWRHMKEGGNAGLFVHSDPLPARGQPFTRSIECQILDGNHGDVFAIHGATMVPDRPHPQGWMRSLPIEERANPAGEWNHYRVDSRDGTLTLAVNGKVVSGGSELNPRKGYICLESEGSEVHFRNIRIRELPSTNPSPEVTADEYQDFALLYNGVDLSGWRSSANAPWRPDDWILRSEGTSKTTGAEGNRTGSDGNRTGPDGNHTRSDGNHTGSDGNRTAPDGDHLWTEQTYGDFELIADWRVDCESGAAADTGSGIFLRGSADAEIFVGCEAAMVDHEVLVRAEAGEGESRSARGWSRLAITVRGRHLSVEFDGSQIADLQLPPGVPARGAIGLADYGAPIEFANLFVKEL